MITNVTSPIKEVLRIAVESTHPLGQYVTLEYEKACVYVDIQDIPSLIKELQTVLLEPSSVDVANDSTRKLAHKRMLLEAMPKTSTESTLRNAVLFLLEGAK